MTTREALHAAGLLVLAFVILLGTSLYVFARDTTGLSALLSPEQQEWTRGLKSKAGAYCCDNADGIDPIWAIEGDHYVVTFQGKPLKVEPDALLTQPNRLGVARAWIGYRDGGPFVRCFLPGPTI